MADGEERRGSTGQGKATVTHVIVLYQALLASPWPPYLTAPRPFTPLSYAAEAQNPVVVYLRNETRSEKTDHGSLKPI